MLPDLVVGALAPKVAAFAQKLPKPYKVETGGLYEESATSSASVFAVVPLMIVLMLATMMVHARELPAARDGGGAASARPDRRRR